ncbi:MAG TPA: hypothetical protein VN285_09515 [Candidatus Deferrimicrobium sp.]|nr:hypothetical protein [Candidatus Deferrimicrobium sp.]
MKGVVSAVLMVVVSSALLQAQPFPPGPDNDTASSLGIFRIYIKPQFQGLMPDLQLPPCSPQLDMNGCYGGPDAPNRLTSPILFDFTTTIARSNPHTHGPSEPATTPVGTGIYATMVGDADFTEVPPGFQGPNGRTEVHTAVAAMELSPIGPGGPIGAPMVRAGHALGLPLCPGEVESQAGTDLPGESFFDVFVEVTIEDPSGSPWGANMVVRNPKALLIKNDSVPHLPPVVVYLHENSTAVPVVFVNSNPPKWNAGDTLGLLTLAGHGYSYGLSKEGSLAEFMTIMNDHLLIDGEMPLSCCNGDGIRGNVDGTTGPSGEIDVSDLTFLVAYLFQAGTTPPCVPEGNVDGITGPAGQIDVADLTHLVAYLFQGGATPPPCA